MLAACARQNMIDPKPNAARNIPAQRLRGELREPMHYAMSIEHPLSVAELRRPSFSLLRMFVAHHKRSPGADGLAAR
jgi:hypothetical protein